VVVVRHVGIAHRCPASTSTCLLISAGIGERKLPVLSITVEVVRDLIQTSIREWRSPLSAKSQIGCYRNLAASKPLLDPYRRRDTRTSTVVAAVFVTFVEKRLKVARKSVTALMHRLAASPSFPTISIGSEVVLCFADHCILCFVARSRLCREMPCVARYLPDVTATAASVMARLKLNNPSDPAQ